VVAQLLSAATLTRQLLAFSRQQVLRDEEVEINRVVEGLLKMVRRVIGERIRLEFFPGEELGALRGDPGQIEQALLNLCINARDAMPAGGRLSLETRSFVADEDFCSIHGGIRPGPHVQLVVSDTGVGMSQEVLDHLFEPFFTTQEIGRGTGLGLATVYGIVKQHKGSIHAARARARATSRRPS
jgi:signal transduction histidine kinase